MKRVVAVKPWHSPNAPMHEMSVFAAWQNLGGRVCVHKKPPRVFDGILYRYLLPTISINNDEARLKFLSGQAVKYLSFPDYIHYEIIPIFWDSWPRYQADIKLFLKTKHINTAFFTSSQVAKKMSDDFPQMNIQYISEGVDVNLYNKGLELHNRSIDILEYGRMRNQLHLYFPPTVNHIYSKDGKKLYITNKEFIDALCDTKITLCFPRSVTHPELTRGIETLTQRYWENMLCRVVMVGYSPKELINILGYDPVLPIDYDYPEEQIMHILSHIDNYQPLVDKNRQYALERGNWTSRVSTMMESLKGIGYEI